MSTALVVAGGAAAIAGVISYASTFNDGTRKGRDGRYGPHYQLEPNSQDAARASIGSQRLMAGFGTVVGAGALGVALLGNRGPTLHLVVGGALALGAGVGALAKLSGAESNVDPALPQSTPEGESDMTRHNKYQYQQEGAGYNAYGIYQGATWGPTALSPTYQRSDLDRAMPTVPNWLQTGSYFGGNVDPNGSFRFPVPTPLPDVNALSHANAQNFVIDQGVLEQLHALRTAHGQ